MRRIRLGRDGPEVSALGFGGAVLSGSYGPIEEGRALAVLRRALDLGITFLDTADVYGNGRNEELIGEAVRGRGARGVVATKVGMIRSADRGRTIVNGRPDHIVAACDASLRRLGVEAIDLYYLHRVDPAVPIEESVGALQRLVEAGKVRALGLSEVAPATLRRAQAVHPITALQMEHSLWARDCEAEILPLCRTLGIVLVAYCPLGRGFLTGSVAADRLDQQDIRRRDPRFADQNLRRNRDLLRPLASIASRHDCRPGQIALAWLLSRDVIPIPGTGNIAHLEENAAAASIQLSAAELAQLDAQFRPGIAAGERAAPEALARLGL